MDIRNWFKSPKTSSVGQNVNKFPDETEFMSSLPKKEAKKSRKRIIESDSDDDDDESPKKSKLKSSPKDLKRSKSSPIQNGSKSKKKKSDSKTKKESSGDENDVIKIKSSKESAVLRTSPRKTSMEKPTSKPAAEKLKVASVSSFFNAVPVQRSSKPIQKNETKKIILEKNHGDNNFEKTLSQVDQQEKDKLPTPKKHTNNHDVPKPVAKKEVTPPKRRKNSKKLSSDIEMIPPSPPVKDKKEKVIETTPAKKIPSKVNRANYMSYVNREGPRALGSKEIPEPEAGCLSNKTFVVTGVLECIERDEAKALVEKCGGKVMVTLSKKTNYMVVGRDAGSSKLEKAEQFGTTLLDEDGLFDLIRKSYKHEHSRKKVEVPELKPSVEMEEVAELVTETPLVENKPVPLKKEENLPMKSGGNDIEKNIVKKSAAPSTSSQTSISSQMWVDKYKPTTLKQIIGQQGEKSNAQKLLGWLRNWHKNTKGKKPVAAGRWNTNDNGAGFKCALLSGPPGVGKTTTALLVCKELDFDHFELNASDTRSKKSLQSAVTELLLNQSLSHCFNGSERGTVSKNHVVIMDEVDGMAGNEDRGGIQELISFIKASKVPIICICNDRNHPKIRSLSNYCFDLRFQRPRVEQIKASIMSIAFKENLKIAPAALQDVITAANQDIRQVLHNLSLWASKSQGLTEEQAKKDIGHGTKHIKMSPFDVLREVFAIGQNKNASIADKSALFFHDYSIAPLFVQENYVHVLPKEAGGNKQNHLRLLSEAANSMCVGDVIDKLIRSRSAWSLLPTQAIFASVIPGDLLAGHLKQMISFPSWLGKNSTRNHMDRVLQELQVHMRMRITGNKTDIALAYLPLLQRALTKPLLDKETEGVRDVLKVMENYCLLREDFDSIVELGLWSNMVDPRTKINSKVKSAFTRAYNKESGKNPYAVTNVSKKKRGASKDLGGEGAEDEEDYVSETEEGDDDKIENDAMIKVKKQTSKSVTDSATTSKKPSKKARTKK